MFTLRKIKRNNNSFGEPSLEVFRRVLHLIVVWVRVASRFLSIVSFNSRLHDDVTINSETNMQSQGKAYNH